MLELNEIRVNKSRITAGLRKRNWDTAALGIIDRILDLDDQRKTLQAKSDILLAERNTLSKRIGDLIRERKQEEAEQVKYRVTELKINVDELQIQSEKVRAELEDLLITVPNIPHESVTAGKSAEDNEIARAWHGALPTLYDSALPHWDLATKYNLIDFKLGVKITGSGFVVFRGKGAKLERALISFFLDRAIAAGFEEIMPPLLVNADTARGTGQLPDKEGQMYFAERDGLYLIPTAEVPVTNLYRDEIVAESDLPIKLCSYTPCFRREAGSYGSDVKGLNRVHQFDKVEIVQLAHPDTSYDTLQEMVDHVSTLLNALELPYRILKLCGGDMGFTSALTYDFEVFSAAQGKWLEVSSVSNFETFQSNRMQLRFKNSKGKNRLVHTLNGSALALARIVAALLENNQTQDGIRIPLVLQPYTGFTMIS
ncbi:MAG TPA: serine--tRNA ligase [Saprospiraceae bacterium]|nr:serine--tRNA ligase [Saprospiraceae bacterium]